MYAIQCFPRNLSQKNVYQIFSTEISHRHSIEKTFKQMPLEFVHTSLDSTMKRVH
jgi:hypothetical protein